MTTVQTSRTLGCYGFRLSGVADAGGLLVDVPADWPALELRHAPPDGSGRVADAIDDDHAEIVLRHGWIELDRRTGVVTFRLPTAPPSA